MTSRRIYCCQCEQKVDARLTNGQEIYPHRQDFEALPFWKCDFCKNHVGCHHKTNNPTNPLGVIPSKELRSARQHIHRILDPLWQSKKIKRGDLYAKLSDRIGWGYHTSHIRTIEEARSIYKLVREIAKEIA